MRQKTAYGDPEKNYLDTFGEVKLVGDLHRETENSRESAPQYSMRPKTATPKPAPRPGPGEYSISSTVGPESHPVASNTPAWGFDKADRDKAHGGIASFVPKTPAPGQYNVTKDGAIGRVDQDSVPAYSIRAKSPDPKDPLYRQMNNSPRPGVHEYDITHDHVDLAKSTAPKFTMRAKASSPRRSMVPGPDAYAVPGSVGNPEHPQAPASPVCKFGKTERDKAAGGVMALMPTGTPSPAEYNVSQADKIGRVDQEKVPAYSMRARLNDRSDPDYKQKVSPRPGVHEYTVTRDHVDLARSKSPKYTMRARTPTPTRSKSPAPGQYDNRCTVASAHPVSAKAPMWQFGSSSRENAIGRIMQFVPATPSPTAYNVVQNSIGRVDQEKVPCYTMRARSKDRRNDLDFKMRVSPRPGVHDYAVTHDHVDLAKCKAPKYTMAGRERPRSKSRERSPGPACYDVPRDVGRTSRSASPLRQSSAWGFGSSARFKAKKPDTRVYCY